MQLEIYTKDNCSYCEQAKVLLDINELSYKQHKIGENITREEVMAKFPNVRTVPLIVIDEKYIGGYNELRDYLLNRG